MTVELREWHSVYNLLMDLDQSRVVKLNNMSLISIDSVYIGGMTLREQAKFNTYTSGYYLDKVEIKNFELNNANLFTDKYMNQAAQRSIRNDMAACNVSSLFSNKAENANNKIYLKMKRNYAEFIEAEASQFSNKSRTNTTCFSGGFNFTIDFAYAFEDTLLVSEIRLIESDNSVLRLNLIKSRFELLINSQVVASIRADFSRAVSTNRLILLADLGTISFQLNDLKQDFPIKEDNLSHFQLFTSSFIQIDLNHENNFEFKQLYVNKNRIEALYRPVFSSLPITNICSNEKKVTRIEETISTTNPNNVNKNAFSTVSTDINSTELTTREFFFYNIAVVALIISVFSLIVFLVVLIGVYIREQRKRLRNRSQFNSKNRLELSLNNSCSLPNTSSMPSESSPSKNSGDSLSMTRTNTLCSSNALINTNATSNNMIFVPGALKVDSIEFKIDCDGLVKPAQSMNPAENYVEIADVCAGLTFEQLKHMLNWVPTFNEYENLFYEFGALKNQEHSDEKFVDFPIYDAEKQTYV
jgi:hypothetical protein